MTVYAKAGEPYFAWQFLPENMHMCPLPIIDSSVVTSGEILEIRMADQTVVDTHSSDWIVWQRGKPFSVCSDPVFREEYRPMNTIADIQAVHGLRTYIHIYPTADDPQKVIVRKLCIRDGDPQTRMVLLKFGLTQDGTWIQVEEGERYPDACLLPVMTG